MTKKLTVNSESVIQTHILQWLHMEDILAWRNNSGMHLCNPRKRIVLGPAGSPDIIGIMPDGSGRFFGIEVKAAKGKQNDNQLAFERQVTKWKGVYIVAHSLVEAQQGLDKQMRQSFYFLNSHTARTALLDH